MFEKSDLDQAYNLLTTLANKGYRAMVSVHNCSSAIDLSVFGVKSLREIKKVLGCRKLEKRNMANGGQYASGELGNLDFTVYADDFFNGCHIEIEEKEVTIPATPEHTEIVKTHKVVCGPQ